MNVIEIFDCERNKKTHYFGIGLKNNMRNVINKRMFENFIKITLIKLNSNICLQIRLNILFYNWINHSKYETILKWLLKTTLKKALWILFEHKNIKCLASSNQYLHILIFAEQLQYFLSLLQNAMQFYKETLPKLHL